MKKALLFLVITVVIGAGFVLAYFNLPLITSYFLGRLTDSFVAISGMTISRDGSFFDVHFRGIRFKGTVGGSIGQGRLIVDLRKGPYIKLVSFSDFHIVPGPIKRSATPFDIPIERVEIGKGICAYKKEKVFIDLIHLENINVPGKQVSFSAKLRHDKHFKTIDVTGQGTYQKGVPSLNGTVRFTGIDLSLFQNQGSVLRGSVDGGGTVAYQDDTFTFRGRAEATNYHMMESWLRRPVLLEKLGGNVHLSAKGKSIDLDLQQVLYKETPFAIRIHLDNMEITNLELKSEYVDVRDVAYHATADYSLQTLWDTLQSGKVRAHFLRYSPKKGVSTSLEVRDLAMTYQDMAFREMAGSVAIDMQRVTVTGISGVYRTSAFADVNSTIPFEGDTIVTAEGRYSLNLVDLPPFIDLKGIAFRKGTTEGKAVVKAKKGKDLDIRGFGTLSGAETAFKKIVFDAEGSYTFTENTVSFSTLALRHGNSRLSCKGYWNDTDLDFAVTGPFDTAQLGLFVTGPPRMTGMAQLDGTVKLESESLHIDGKINMNDIAFQIPGYAAKPQGAPSTAQIEMTKKGALVTIERLFYELDGLKLQGSGTILDSKTVNARVIADIPSIARVAPYFLLPKDTAKGDLSLNLVAKNMELPLKKLPNLTGHVKVNNGFLRLPGLSTPLAGVNLAADFKGTSMDMTVQKLVYGKSTVKQGTLHLQGLDAPKFSLNVDLDRLDLTQSGKGQKSEIRIPLIPQGSILAQASGDISVKAKTVGTDKLQGKNLEITAFMADRKINVSECRTSVFDGNADIKGTIDLSGSDPSFYINSKLLNARSDLLFSAFDTTPREITGKTYVQGTIKTEGGTIPRMIADMDGTLIIYSQDGVIRKWNFLSKLFSLLNLYDLIKGKISFGQNGLVYSKLGATFNIKKGVFHTENFLLDSPSMVITGNGTTDLNKMDVNGTINVSPLIVIDRTIDKIPLVRSILKKKGQGFLYLSYNIKGPLDDPQISPTLTGTVGTKTIELFRNILVLPKEVFEP